MADPIFIPFGGTGGGDSVADWTYGASDLVAADWADANDYDSGTDVTPLISAPALVDTRFIKATVDGTAGSQLTSGVVREVASGDFCYAIRLAFEFPSLAINTARYAYLHGFFYNAQSINAAGAARVFAAGVRFQSSNIGTCQKEACANVSWGTLNQQDNVPHYESGIDVLIDRSGTDIRLWCASPGAGFWNPIANVSGYTTTADAGLFGVYALTGTVGGGNTGSNVNVHIKAFRDFGATCPAD